MNGQLNNNRQSSNEYILGNKDAINTLSIGYR